MKENLEDLVYYTNSPLILYNTEYKSGGVQKLSGVVFCTDRTAEKLTVLDQANGESILKEESNGIMSGCDQYS